jgi:uridine phosphorylase
VALAAVNRDGTSRSYLPDCFPAIADHNLVRRLCERIGERIGKTLDASIVWTTDGRWIESDGDIEELSRLGVAAVDMESAALFAAARRRDIGSASISVITDLPVLHLGQEFKGVPQSEREWREVVVPRARMVLEVVLEALGTRDLGHA